MTYDEGYLSIHTVFLFPKRLPAIQLKAGLCKLTFLRPSALQPPPYHFTHLDRKGNSVLLSQLDILQRRLDGW